MVSMDMIDGYHAAHDDDNDDRDDDNDDDNDDDKDDIEMMTMMMLMMMVMMMMAMFFYIHDEPKPSCNLKVRSIGLSHLLRTPSQPFQLPIEANLLSLI